jgi:hypothetical protein
MTSMDNSNAGIIQSGQNDAPSKVKLMIHHQFPNAELVSPVYAGKGTTSYLSPDQKVDVGSTMQTDFNIDLPGNESIGALMYKLQRKNIDQSTGASCVQLVIIWKVNSFKALFAVSDLIEHDKHHVWDKDRLMKLAKRCRLFNVRHNSTERAWLMRDNIVLMTRINITLEEECYKLKMTISKTSIKDDTRRLRYIDVDR